jgi:hypothetical protein
MTYPDPLIFYSTGSGTDGRISSGSNTSLAARGSLRQSPRLRDRPPVGKFDVHV